MRLRFLVIGALLLSLCVLEVISRYVVVSPAKIVHDSQLGPMKAGHTEILRTYEGYSRFQTDVFGFNNDPLPQPASQYWPQHRLLILGDSFVEAEQLMRPDNFVAQLDKLPNTLAYNAGYSGADPRSFPLLVERLLPKLQPTQIILCVNGGDLSALTSLKPPQHDPPTGIKAWLQPLFAHSALATHLNWKYKAEIERWWRGHIQQENQYAESAVSNFDQQRERWRLILQGLKNKDIPLLVVFLPSIRYSPEGVQAVDSPAINILAEVAMRLDIDVIHTEQAFKVDFDKSSQVALGFSNSHIGEGHLNHVGHDVMADVISSYLEMYL